MYHLSVTLTGQKVLELQDWLDEYIPEWQVVTPNGETHAVRRATITKLVQSFMQNWPSGDAWRYGFLIPKNDTNLVILSLKWGATLED